METKLLDSLLKAFVGTRAEYMRISEEGLKLEVRKRRGDVVKYAAQGQMTSANKNMVRTNEKKKGEAKSFKARSFEDKKSFHDVKSEYVGFVQRRESGKDTTIVKLREVVEKGQLLAYVNSMNIRYEVLSDIKGKIVEVLVEDMQAVEYSQPLFRLKPI